MNRDRSRSSSARHRRTGRRSASRQFSSRASSRRSAMWHPSDPS